MLSMSRCCQAMVTNRLVKKAYYRHFSALLWTPRILLISQNSNSHVARSKYDLAGKPTMVLQSALLMVVQALPDYLDEPSPPECAV